VAAACERLIVLCHGAARFGLPPPPAAGWQPLESIVLSIAAGEAPAAPDFPPDSAAAVPALTSSASSAGLLLGALASPAHTAIAGAPLQQGCPRRSASVR